MASGPMEESVEVVNPLQLTLDEIIALNKVRNQAKDQNDDTIEEISVASSLAPKPTTNGLYTKKHWNKKSAEILNNRLRSTPGFGSRQIHQRLGWFPHFKKRHPSFNQTQAMAQRTVQRAKVAIWKKRGVNPVIRFTNPDAQNDEFIAPLTRNAVTKFNRINNSGFVGSSLGSTRSIYSSRPPIKRHSIKACLNPEIQEALRNMTPKTLTDFSDLEQFAPSVTASLMATNDRFSMYF